ncbi:hypothetical protein DTX79_17245, partial [Bacilli bacterium]
DYEGCSFNGGSGYFGIFFFFVIFFFYICHVFLGGKSYKKWRGFFLKGSKERKRGGGGKRGEIGGGGVILKNKIYVSWRHRIGH